MTRQRLISLVERGLGLGVLARNSCSRLLSVLASYMVVTINSGGKNALLLIFLPCRLRRDLSGQALVLFIDLRLFTGKIEVLV